MIKAKLEKGNWKWKMFFGLILLVLLVLSQGYMGLDLAVKDSSGQTVLFRYTIRDYRRLNVENERIKFNFAELGSGMDSDGIFLAKIGMTHI
jgi:hypothetical protein